MKLIVKYGSSDFKSMIEINYSLNLHHKAAM